jgi:hypothetical protein
MGVNKHNNLPKTQKLGHIIIHNLCLEFLIGTKYLKMLDEVAKKSPHQQLKITQQ